MEAGAAEREITPSRPISLGGFPRRTSDFTSIHDPLYVRCGYFEGESGGAALLSFDLVALPDDFVARLKRRLAYECGIPMTRITLHATHTHAGPTMDTPFCGRTDVRSRPYKEHVMETAVHAMKAAMKNAERVQLCTGRVSLDNVGGIHGVRGPVPLPVGVTGFVNMSGRVRLALVSFPCHPTVLGPENQCISADYPGACTATVRRLLERDTVVMFLTGSTGDVSTRFTRRAQTHWEVERLGTAVGAAAVSALLTGDMKTIRDVHILKRALRLPLVSASQLQRARQDIDTDITVMAFDTMVRYAFWPGEPYFSFDRRLKAVHGEDLTLVGYTDGMIGEIPDASVSSDLCEEAVTSLVGHAGGEKLFIATHEMLREAMEASQKWGTIH